MTQHEQQQSEDRRRRRPALWLLLLCVVLSLLAGLIVGRGMAPEGAAVQPGQASQRPPVEAVLDDPVAASDVTVVLGTADGSDDAASTADLAVSGRVVGRVAPGADAALLVSVGNPLVADVLVTAVSGAVTSVSPSSCRAAWFRVGGFTGARMLAAGGRETVELPVTFLSLPTVNQDACRGATYRFTVDVRARQA